MGFADENTQTLIAVRRNLLRGLDRVAEHVDAGTLHIIPENRSSSPAEVGQITLWLLNGVTAELTRRDVT